MYGHYFIHVISSGSSIHAPKSPFNHSLQRERGAYLQFFAYKGVLERLLKRGLNEASIVEHSRKILMDTRKQLTVQTGHAQTASEDPGHLIGQ